MKRGMVKFFILVLLTFLTFLVLKALGITNWSWVWVLSPLWIVGGIMELSTLFCIIRVGIDGTLDVVENE